MRNDMLVAAFSIFASAVTCAAAPLPTARELAESQGGQKSDYRAALGKCLYRAEAVERGGNFVSLPGILNPKRGTVICRVKRDDGASPKSRQTIFAFGGKGGHGSGRLSAYYDIAKGTVNRDSMNGVGGANINNVLLTSDRELTVVTWDETHSRYYSSNLMRPYSARPSGYPGSMKDAVRPPKEVDFDPATPPDTLFIGRGADGKSALKGEIASFELYEGSLDDYEAEALISSKRKAHLEASRHYFREDELVDVLLEMTPLNGFDVRGAELRLGSEKVPSAFRRRLPVGDYVFSAWKDGRELARDRVSVLRSDNPYVLPHDGHGEFEGLELVETVDIAALAEDPAATNRFASVGKWSVGELNGEKYVEAGPRKGNRFAVRFNVPTDAPLCCIELVYPDDKRRTADIMVQKTADGDETLAVGYAGGGGFELTNRMRSYKCLYWTAESDVTAIVMTSHSGGPAALARINVYRVKGAGVSASSATLPPPAPDGDFRHSVAWWEDPVLFQLFQSKWENAQELSDTIDRLAATMKFAGQDMMVYPGAFYSGLMDETEDPRRWSFAHPPHYFEALYAKFDEQGLCASPEINWQQWRFPRPEEVTPESLTNGSLHATAISYATNGLPSAGIYTSNGRPAGHNVQHPQIQAELGRMFDYFIREGMAHPSFKGVTLFATQKNPCVWGSIERGYNDYNIDAFEKSAGIKVPVDRADPMRAEKYAKWLLTNAYDEWVAWRCDVVCDFYAMLAEKLRAARSDLKLHVICHSPMDRRRDADFGTEGHERRLELEMGIDTAKLQAKIPNLVMTKVIHPLRHRKRSNWFKTDEAKNVYRDRALKCGFYNALYSAEYPGILLFDEFVESNAAGLKKTVGLFDAPWLKEIDWRVSMWNATGENAMKFHAVPLRFGDVLSLARGGYLIGSYGMEPLTAEFMRNFRALPAVKFDDLPSGEFVKLRQKDYAGRSWFYIVNTDDTPQTVEVEFPNGSVALADGANCEGRRRITLAPYSIRSFSAPIGTMPIAVAGAVRSSAFAGAAAQVKTFDVSPQGVYELRLKTGAAPEGATARLVFLDEHGKDVAPVEASLGFSRSGGAAKLPKDGGETVLVSAAGNGIVRAVKARVEIGGADASVVQSCSLTPFSACEDPKHTSGIDNSAKGDGRFSSNLVKNPSFEEDSGWQWVGGGKDGTTFRFSGDSYTGARSVALDPASDGKGALVSDAFPVDRAKPLHYSYAVRFSRFAKPHGHKNPVRIEFLAQQKDGSFRVLSRSEREFNHTRYTRFAGEWTLVAVRGVPVPARATHARVIVEHRDTAKIWIGDLAAGWGTVLADDISVWQGDGLPPQLPVGKLRDNSISAVQDAWRDGALFFDDGTAPTLTLRLENLLGWSRELELHGVVTDKDGKAMGIPFVRKFSLAPFASAIQDFALPEMPRYGAYQIGCEIVDHGAGIVCRTQGLFARIAHPSRATAADKASGHYPFDMHSGVLGFTRTNRMDECEFEARMMGLLGVRGTRLAAGYSDMGFSREALDSISPERIDELAAAAVARFRENVKPTLDRHGVRGWITLGAQGRGNTAGAVKTPEQLEKWERFHRSFARELGGDVDFVLFDSEGTGGYTAHLGDDDDLFPLSGFTGTTREWMIVARHAVKGLKDGNPALPVGLSHANDRGATAARRFLRMKEGGFPVDCWGCNSYTGPQLIAPAIYEALGRDRTSKMFFVIPELGESTDTPKKANAAAQAMLRYYVQTLARAPWTRHINWFRFLGTFESSAGGGARATAAAFAVMTDTLRAGSAGKEVPLTGGAFIPWRRLDGSSVAVAWSSAGQKVVFAVPDGRCLVESDVYGNRKEHVPAGGRVEVAVGPVAYYWIEGKVVSAPGFAPGCMPVDEESVTRERVRAALAAARSSGSANLVRNAAFVGEGTNLPPEWKGETPPGKNGTKLEDCRFTREVGAGPDGEAALFIDNRVKDKLKGGSYPVISQEVPVEEGETYVFRVLFKSVRSGQWIQGQIDALDAGGKVKRRIPAPESQEREGEWAVRELEFTVKKGETAVRILLKGNGGGAGAFYSARPELRRVKSR